MPERPAAGYVPPPHKHIDRRSLPGPISPALSLLLLLLLLSACSGAQPSLASADVVEVLNRPVDGRFARALKPLEFEFPRDHGPHNDYATEWWYYTGNLTGEEGGEYGFQLTFFRSALAPGESNRPSDFAAQQLYMAHFAVTSGPADRHVSFDRFSRGAGGVAGATGSPRYEVWLDDWRAQETAPGQTHLQAAAEDDNGPVSIDLTLTESRPPLLHGEAGYSRKGPEPGNANHYYSLVRMETAGEIVFAGRRIPVTGLSWMDHEFGTSALSADAVGWDWFAVTLDNDVVLMFAEIRTESGTSQEIFEGTLGFPDGRQVSISADDFTLTTTGQWTSPDSGTVYPGGWRVTFPQHEIELSIDPLIDDQEMDVAFRYYEGATVVRGTMNGEPVAGRGYVELTGYGQGGFQR
ncbi:MAG: carotenoid 1,2-hydratase [Caldilineaceae bacterium SB0670_bin_27]|uniref:Carotenoid 1,2-hydratase n=1 Tax=Caldilineaceae bacterium SB0664_bin_27 TaxID=2605260 RepID=A0A6B0YZM6_9CHLR|nr:carotenoid 1,2-hydratase [Caldilineaceae bacterium SB0664_bin_27]MYJ79127.1 carotenoid 1,2-hydratase [Caldilineaceae bacterium SB0670_bin_27]